MKPMLCTVVMLIIQFLGPTGTANAARLEWMSDLPLPGRPARFDYEALDPASGRLYINKMGANQVLVYDVRARRLVAALPDFPSATCITLAAQRGLAFVSTPGYFLNHSTGPGSVRVLRLSDLATVATLETDAFPDGSVCLPVQGKLFVSNEHGGSETVIGGEPLRLAVCDQCNQADGPHSYWLGFRKHLCSKL